MSPHFSARLRAGIGSVTRTLRALGLVALLALPSAALTITSFSPAGGPGGTAVTLVGSGFSAVTTVKFNGIGASFSVQDDSHLTASVPGSATTGLVSVSNGSSTTYSATNFFVGYVPYVGSFSPTGGPAGTVVTINGSYFSGVTAVAFNGVPASFTVNSTTQIVATVPAGAATGEVSVTNPAGTGSRGTYYFPPVVGSFAPAGGSVGTAVHVDGTNFAIVSQVLFGDVNASFSLQDNNHILAYVPSGAITAPIRVISFAGNAASASSFFVGPAPTVTDVSPTGGPVGTPVTITGSDFQAVTGVTFAGVSAPFTVVNATKITATVPGAAVTGSVAVSNPAGTGTWSRTFYVGGAPVVSGFTPTAGPVGSSVTISGSGFSAATDVRFGAVAATFVANSDAQITATVPAGASTAAITVANPSGTGASAANFLVSPRIIAFSPTTVAASTAEGTEVTITGYNFTGLSAVYFNGVLASCGAVDDHTVLAWVPTGATTGPITLTTPAGTATSPFPFEIVVFTPPPHSPYASWPLSTSQNLPICTAANDQYAQAICADSTGGAYIAWQDYRSGDWDIYLQRVTAYGDVAPGWPVNGLKVCGVSGEQSAPQIVADQVGGAMVVWMDRRTGGAYDIYATRVRSDGTLAPGWGVDGNAACNEPADQQSPALCPDGAGGAYVSWHDSRYGQWDVFVTRMLSSGAIASGWDTQGLLLTPSGYPDYSSRVSPDGTGGAYVSWCENSYYGFITRVTPAGLIAPGWPSGGYLFSTGTMGSTPLLVPDQHGDVFVAWTSAYALYVQKMKGDATVGWPSAVGFGSNNYNSALDAIPDGQGGIIVGWGAGSLYAGRVTNAGSVAAGWSASGVQVGYGSYVRLASDGYGGAFATWQDNRQGEWNIFAQRVFSAGTLASGWVSTGSYVSNAPLTQSSPVVTSSALAGAIVAFEDNRSGVFDVYAQNIGLSGKPGNLEPHITSVKDVAADQGGKVRITWQASRLDTMPTMEIATYGIWRRVSGTAAQAALRRGASLFSTADAEVRPGALRRERADAQDVWWEGLGSIPARGQLTYSFVAATISDSTASGPGTEVYMVDAHASYGPYFWSTAPDSGHSVDNIAPGTPQAFVATYQPGSEHLAWAAVADNDLAEYRVYRGATPDFVPAEENRVGSTTQLTFVDAFAGQAVYKLVAVDVHGNASAPASALPPAFADVSGGLPDHLELAAPSPNPARASTSFVLRTPRRIPVELAIFDPAGRCVRRDAPREVAAGEHFLSWDLRDGTGRRVSNGLYFVRVQAGDRTFRFRIVTLD